MNQIWHEPMAFGEVGKKRVMEQHSQWRRESFGNGDRSRLAAGLFDTFEVLERMTVRVAAIIVVVLRPSYMLE